MANIAATPLAAMVLVQLLRATEGLEVERALVFESFAYATLQAGPEFRRWLAQGARPAADPGNDSGRSGAGGADGFAAAPAPEPARAPQRSFGAHARRPG